MFLKEIRTYFLIIYSVQMFVFIPDSIPPVRFGPGGTDLPERSISPVTYTSLYCSFRELWDWFQYSSYLKCSEHHNPCFKTNCPYHRKFIVGMSTNIRSFFNISPALTDHCGWGGGVKRPDRQYAGAYMFHFFFFPTTLIILENLEK